MADRYAFEVIIPGYVWRSKKEPPRVEDHGWSSGWIYPGWIYPESEIKHTHTHTHTHTQRSVPSDVASHEADHAKSFKDLRGITRLENEPFCS